MNDPFSATKYFVSFTHFDPAAVGGARVPGPIPLSTLLDTGTFEDFSESIIRFMVGDMLDFSYLEELGVAFDLG